MLEYFAVGEERAKPEPVKKEPVRFEKFVTVMIPIAFPGSGKTTLHEEMLRKYFKVNKDVKYTLISND